jgi:hypothetical protein
LEYELKQLNGALDKGVPTDNRQVDSYINSIKKSHANLVQWLEGFRGKYGEEEAAQQAIKDTEAVLQKYKQKTGGMLAKVEIEKAIEARAADGSPLVALFFLLPPLSFLPHFSPSLTAYLL